MNIGKDKLQVDDTIKFYFWINVSGICTGVENANGKINTIISDYSENLLSAPPKSVNGFKLMNDEREMLNLILPKIENIGDVEYKEKVKARAFELAELAKEEKKRRDNAAANGAVDDDDDGEEVKKEEAEPEKKGIGSMKEQMAIAVKATIKV